MGTKKMIKQLMAEGVQRNDAAAFVKTYQKLKFNPVIRQFPELIVPLPDGLLRPKTIYPKTYAVQHVMPKIDIAMGSIDWERYVRDRLSEKLTKGLVGSGFILFEHKEFASDVVFTAKLRVLPPEAVEAYTLGQWG